MKIQRLLFCFFALLFFESVSAEDYTAKCKESMATLKDLLTKLGPAKIEGLAKVAGKEVPVLYFGTSKINLNYEVVDKVKKLHGGTATVFVKNGEEFTRISTNVMKDGESRAIGTVLARNAAYAAIIKGEAFYGQVDIIGTLYETGYEPIKSSEGETVGIFYVGYPKK